VSTTLATNLETIRYNTNFLTEVIARIDLVQAIPGLNQSLPKSLETAVTLRFPISEPQKIIAKGLQISSAGVKQFEGEGLQWHFFGKERKQKLSIDPDSLIFVHSSYETFEMFTEGFLEVVRAFFAAYPDAVARRFGLRYINNVRIPEKGLFEWNDYIHEDLLGLFRFYPEHSRIVRAFNNLELNFGDLRVRFQFGMHNPDYPAPIRANHFILDLDGYVEGTQPPDHIKMHLLDAHTHVQQLFEQSITGKMREVLNA
jgi:uncharacterized protein (TIGR04255 family)